MTENTFDKLWFSNRDLLKRALQHADIKSSIMNLIIKELNYKNGEIEYIDYQMDVDFQDFANQLATYFEEHNLIIIKP